MCICNNIGVYIILQILYIIPMSVSANFGCNSAFWAWIYELCSRCSALAMVFVL